MDRSPNVPEQEKRRFYQLYQDQYRAMLRYAMTIFNARGSSDPGDGRAEEAVQEAFAYAWANRRALFDSPNPGGWLFKVLYYKVLERVKEENKWTRNIRTFEELAAATRQPDPYAQVEDSLQGLLSDEDYRLLRRLYVEKATYLELCREYQLTKSALGSRVHRIKKKIREHIKKQFDG